MAAQQNGSPILEVEHEEIPRNMVIQQMNPAMSWLYRSHALSLPIAELMEVGTRHNTFCDASLHHTDMPWPPRFGHPRLPTGFCQNTDCTTTYEHGRP